MATKKKPAARKKVVRGTKVTKKRVNKKPPSKTYYAKRGAKRRMRAAPGGDIIFDSGVGDPAGDLIFKAGGVEHLRIRGKDGAFIVKGKKTVSDKKLLLAMRACFSRALVAHEDGSLIVQEKS